MPRVLTCPSCRTAVPFPEGFRGPTLKCPHCAARVRVPVARPADEDIVDALPAGRPARAADDDDVDYDYKPCPKCGATGAQRVVWTPWGSFYGPLFFTHVRCPECGYKYNGRTGRSNLVPAIIMVLVPLLGIIAIVGGLAYMIRTMYVR